MRTTSSHQPTPDRCIVWTEYKVPIACALTALLMVIASVFD